MTYLPAGGSCRVHLPHFSQFSEPSCPEGSYYYGQYYEDPSQQLIALQHCYGEKLSPKMDLIT